MTTAEKIVTTAVMDALSHWRVVNKNGLSDVNNGHLVKLDSTLSPDGRVITVVVEPFNGDEPTVQVELLVSAARPLSEVAAPEPAVNGVGTMDEPETAA